jgi:putative peptide zinc metalloprotease protein
MIVVSQLLFWLAEEVDGHNGLPEAAENLSGKLGATVGVDGVTYLLDHKLGPLGVIAGAGEQSKSPAAVLALAGRAALIPPQAVRRVAGLLQHLFHAPVVGIVLASVIALHLWLLSQPGSLFSTRAILEHPATLLSIVAMTALGGLFHEFGHGSACLYGGAEPGAIGAGIYILWPAFFTDITESYRLDRLGRIRTDLGGIYFNLILSLILGSLYGFTGNPVWLWAALAQDLMILQQFIPFLRLDGYYLITDLTGVPDLFGHVRPILSSLVPGRAVDRRIDDLRPGVRIAVAVWVLSTVAILAWFGVRLALGLPQIMTGAWHLTASLWDSTALNLRSGRVAAGLAALVQSALVTIQALGIMFLLAKALAWTYRHAGAGILKFAGRS